MTELIDGEPDRIQQWRRRPKAKRPHKPLLVSSKENDGPTAWPIGQNEFHTLHVALLPSFISNALGLEFGLGKGAACKYVDRDLNLAAGSDLGRDAACNLIWCLVAVMFEASGHDVQPVWIRGDHNLELVAGAFNRSNRLLDLNREHLDPAHIDQIIGAAGE